MKKYQRHTESRKQTVRAIMYTSKMFHLFIKIDCTPWEIFTGWTPPLLNGDGKPTPCRVQNEDYLFEKGKIRLLSGILTWKNTSS